jgi:hypothetical protein
MLSIHKINPMARAIGTMGVVVAIAAGITYAQIQSNTVTIGNNTLSSANASLEVGLTTTCDDATTSTVQGVDFTNLLPGTPSNSFDFCLDNVGNTPLAITAFSPTNFTGSAINPSDVTLNGTCGTDGTTAGATSFTATVAQLASGQQPIFSSLNNGTSNVLSCQVTATLGSGTIASNATLTPFDVQFVGSSQ